MKRRCFAFKLGYLLDTVKQSMAFNTYEELYSRYGELEEISFVITALWKKPPL